MSCKDCNKRHKACHDECQEYKAYKMALLEKEVNRKLGTSHLNPKKKYVKRSNMWSTHKNRIINID